MDFLVNSYYFLLIAILMLIDCTTSDELLIDDNESPLPHYLTPSDPAYEKLLEGRDVWRAPQEAQQPKLDVKSELERLNSSYAFQETWPTKTREIGVVSAVSFDNNGNVVVFHRSNRMWTAATFDASNVYEDRASGPIRDNTLVAFDRKTGNLKYEWGKDMFYMPHGLTIDQESNFWVTDVALHQVMKFSSKNRTVPELVLGTAFQPGNSQSKFCKPTSVAVLPDGDFFVADGYCNARIIKYSKIGEVLLTWGRNSFQGSVAHELSPQNFFAVPHSLTLAPDKGLLCVADRENGRVQCFSTLNGTFHSQYHNAIVGDRLFSMAYAPINGGQLFVVNGPEIGKPFHQVLGFVIDMTTKEVSSKFGPDGNPFQNPHDIIVTPDGQEVYVAQLTPYRVFKFLSKSPPPITSTIATITAKQETSSGNQSNTQANANDNVTDTEGPKALIIVAVLVLLAIVVFGVVLIVARRQKIGKMSSEMYTDLEYSKLMSKC